MIASAVVQAWMRYDLLVEPYIGATSAGPTYGPMVRIKSFIDPGDSLVRGPGGETVTSTATAYLPTDTDLASVVVGSKATLMDDFGGRTAIIVSVAARASTMGTPDHVEVKLQ
jgi:hypothetical protein